MEEQTKQAETTCASGYSRVPERDKSSDASDAIRYALMCNKARVGQAIANAKVTIIDVETAKIRKHTNDTLWAVLAGFISAGVLVVIMTLIVLGILFFAQGR